MEYALGIDGAQETIPGGTGVLLLHPSTGETDRVDTEFFATDTDAFLVISTRTTAREVKQKLEYYDVDGSQAEILDTLSVERGYSRRGSANVHYVSAPDDLAGIIDQTESFLERHAGKRRISLDSITEMAYYADDEDAVFDTVCELLELLATYEAVGLFHLSDEVHTQDVIDRYRSRFDTVIEVSADGSVTFADSSASSSSA